MPKDGEILPLKSVRL